MLYPFPLTVRQVVERLDEAGTRIFAIMDDTAMVGTVELSQINPEQGTAIICRFLVRQDRHGKGYGQKALHALVDLALQELHLSRLELRVFAYNVAAIRCYQKTGFLVCQYHENQNNPQWNSYTMAIDLGK
ncbi:MAG TPA: GNAT family N-acetyltransferase [Bacillota bacterium]|nr:GNAT family N-acetyltransferase [Bacillota bacterium]